MNQRSIVVSNRIRPIDGWRAIAALGVLWTHTWATTNFQSLVVGKINLFKAINIVGNGVHLFFIISGFCMYLVFRKIEKININVFFSFVYKRWIRIAPAFYFACIVIGIYNLLFSGQSFFPRIIFNVLFIHNLLPDAEISSPFWSLAVEWHFYLILPLLFLLIKKMGLIKTVVFFCFFCLILNLLHYHNHLLQGDGWWYLLPGNLIHFMWGILLSFIIFTNKHLPRWLSNNLSFIIAVALANLGKTLFSGYGLNMAGNYAFVFLSVGPGVMTLGFAWLIYISLKNERIGRIIGNNLFSWLGKISYSFYLWHSFILSLVYFQLNEFLNFGGFNTIILFVVTLIILIPISHLSYVFFESFYFKRKGSDKKGLTLTSD